MISSRRRSRGFTMIELLVTISILAFVLGAIIKVYMAGARFGRSAQEKSEASRIAQAVFDFADTPKDTTLLIDWGRTLDISATPPVVNPAVTDGMIANNTPAAIDIATSEFDLVWEAEISSAVPADFHTLTGVHYLVVTVYKDEDESGTVTPDDREITEFYAVLADR